VTQAQFPKLREVQAQQLSDPGGIGLSEPMMTGQPPGAKRAAILSARTPAQSKQQHPGQVETQPPGQVINGQRRPFQEPANLEKIQVTAQLVHTEGSGIQSLDAP
jgi:hypothetical protein